MNNVYFCRELWECVTEKKELTVTIEDASVIFAAFRDHCEPQGFSLDIALPRCDNVSFPLYFRGVSDFEDEEFILESGELYRAKSVDIRMTEWEDGVCVGIFSNKGAGYLSFFCSEVMCEAHPHFKQFYEKNKNYRYFV